MVCQSPAHPAVFAAAPRAVVGWVIVHYFDVADETYSCIGSFDEVMAQQRVAREPLIQDCVQHGDVVEALAGKNSLAIEVLIDIGRSARVGVHAGLAGLQRRKARMVRRVNADIYARLENAISLVNDPALRVDDRLVQRVSHRADKPGAPRREGVAYRCRV